MKSPSVASVMRREPLTITQTETLAAAQALMERDGIHQLPVIENGTLVGVLSNRDLHAHSGYLESTKVDAAMTSSPVTVAPTDTAQQAALVLLEHRINALPVTEDGRLVGIVSKTDLLRLLVRLLEEPRSET
jgi:CBS domain-containing protein